MVDCILAAVVTTIQSPTPAVIALARQMQLAGRDLIIVGDRKGPLAYPLDGARFYSFEEQNNLEFKLGRLLPADHYGRKNLGYLQALAQRAECIYETDDDNAPLPSWQPREVDVEAVSAERTEWLNAYRHFSGHYIWPRGFPLDEVSRSTDCGSLKKVLAHRVTAPIQQGLANGSPDVDAVWRLVLDAPIEFEDRPSIWLPPGSWCPFNSQSTWWWPEAYPLMYLPSYCSFRMTDIWRSFIAQRCLWELGYGVVFHGAEVFQARNEHNLMRDFSDEISGYLRNKELVGILRELRLQPGASAIGDNLRGCYRALAARGFFPEKELLLLEAWLDDLKAIGICVD